MSVKQLVSHLEECRRRLTEVQRRQDFVALSCAILRAEGPGGAILYEFPFGLALGERPFHATLAISHGESFGVAFYGLACAIEPDKIAAILAPIDAIVREIDPLLRDLPKPVRECLKMPKGENWWRVIFHLAWHFPRPFLRASRRRLLAKDGAARGQR